LLDKDRTPGAPHRAGRRSVAFGRAASRDGAAHRVERTRSGAARRIMADIVVVAALRRSMS
jgi:hypothetical protein